MKERLSNRPLLQRLCNSNKQLISGKFIDLPELYEDIRENLEKLLNTRMRYLKYHHHLQEIHSSVINYGINDFMHNYYGSAVNQAELLAEIRNKIICFEPRLKKTQVILKNEDRVNQRTLGLRIEGSINMAWDSTATAFESTIDLSNHQFVFER